MHVQKRGVKGLEVVKFDKITARINRLKGDLQVDPIQVAKLTIQSIYNGITTEELDRVSATVADSMSTIHPDYSVLAARILVSNLHKTTPDDFAKCMLALNKDVPTISLSHLEFIMKNADDLNKMIVHDNDYLYNYTGIRSLEALYLHKIKEEIFDQFGNPKYVDRNKIPVPPNRLGKNCRGKPVIIDENGKILSQVWKMTRERVMDRPQYMHMRVAIMQNYQPGRSRDDMLRDIKESYLAFSEHYVTHATPTLLNSCTPFPQLGSCFLLGTGDSIEEIMKTITDASFISKRAGGIGVWVHPIRPSGSALGTNGQSSGLPKQLKIYNEAARCWDQGSKRLGAFAMYIEPWHGDIMRILRMKLNDGAETERARDLFYAIWMPDLFMKRLAAGEDWSLFGNDTAPGLADVYDGMDVCKHCYHCINSAFGKYVAPIIGTTILPQDRCPDHCYQPFDAFTTLYQYYEEEGLAVSIVKSAEVEAAIFESQKQSGTPYICYKDVINRESNQKGIGTIKSSNLCCEITEWSSSTSYASCTLASLNLKRFLIKGEKEYSFDLKKLHEITRLSARNLDKVIDVTNYPVPECIQNAKDFRPIAIGIQGLADVFCMMRIPFLSPAARDLDMKIIETIYHAVITESCALAAAKGPFVGFQNSPAARGILQYDLWMANQKRIGAVVRDPRSGLYDWVKTSVDVKTYGLRFSLHDALMPTVSSCVLLGNNDSFEPFHSNIYVKSTHAGKYTVMNSHAVRHLIELGLWNEQMKNNIISAGGSLQKIRGIPADVKEIYLTVWEIKQFELMKAAAQRQAFVDQSQSLNIYVEDNSNITLRSILRAGYKLGLKTGSYYIRTTAAAQPMKTHESGAKVQPVNTQPDGIQCSDGSCCSS